MNTDIVQWRTQPVATGKPYLNATLLSARPIAQSGDKVDLVVVDVNFNHPKLQDAKNCLQISTVKPIR